MIALRPKHSFGSVVENLATELLSGTIRISEDLRKSSVGARQESPFRYLSGGGRQAKPPEDETPMLRPNGSPSKR